MSALFLLWLSLPLGAFPQTTLHEERGFQALRQGRYDDALNAFETLLSQEPDRASAHYGKGLALTGMLNYSAAVDSLENAVSLDPDRAETWRRLVTLYSQLQRDEKAKHAYETARRLGGVPDEERPSLARALRKAGWTSEAQTLLQEARPLGVNEHLELGLIALEEDDFPRAAEHLEEATSDPSHSSAEAEFQYGRSLEALGETNSAFEHYRRALSKDPRLLRARFRLGNLLLRTGDAEQGRALLRGYEEYRQWDRRVKLLLTMVTSGTLSETAAREKTLELVDLLLEGRALADAETLIRSALANDPYDVGFRVAEIEWLISSGELERAREAVEMLQFVADPPSEVHWLSGRIYMLQGNSQEAIKAFEHLSATVSDPPATLLKELATAYAMNGQTDEATSYYHLALEKDPQMAGAHAGLGSLLESTGQPAEAEKQYRHALEINPDLLSAQQLLAELLVSRGDTEEAVALLRRSVNTNPANALLRRNLARALERLGKTGEAAAELEKAQQIEEWKSPRTK